MSRRNTGVSFIAIAAFLFATRFVSAAIWGIGLNSWSADRFATFLSYVDQGLTLWSIVALVVGMVYLVWGEIIDFKN
jgi:hypothetical protein